jgi:hypothetical protein
VRNREAIIGSRNERFIVRRVGCPDGVDAYPLSAFEISLLTGILFGVAPAWITSNSNPADALRSGTRTTTSGASLLQRSLIVLQSALALGSASYAMKTLVRP